MVEQIRTHFANGIGAIVAFIPNLLSALVILLLGYLVSRVLASLTRRVLGRVGFDGFMTKHLRGVASKRSPTSLLGSTVFWLGMLVSISLAARPLELVSLNAGINRILAFVPHVLVAAIILAIAVGVGQLLADLVGDVAKGWLAKGVRAAVLVLGVFMALDELGVAPGIVRTTFVVLLGTVALAAAIAFGVGNIELARETSRRWAHRGGEELERETQEIELPPMPH